MIAHGQQPVRFAFQFSCNLKALYAILILTNMSSMDVDVNVSSFLREARIAAPEHLQGSVLQMEDFWERRLWHQLTLELETFFNDPSSSGLRMRMFKEFVQTFEKNINQLKLVALALLAKVECKGIMSS